VTKNCVGIDLGTMYTTAAGGNGARLCLPSEVGFPKDVVAKHLIGQDFVLGSDIALHRPSLDVIRPFEKNSLKYAIGEKELRSFQGEEAPLNRQAACSIVRHAVDSLELPDPSAARCIVGVPAAASQYSQLLILELVESVAQYAAVVSEPFAVAYGIGEEAKNTVIVDIGAGTVDFCYYYGALPKPGDQSTLGIGGDHVDEELRSLIHQEFPTAKVSILLARKLKERFGSVGSTARAAVAELPTRTGEAQEYDLTNIIRDVCLQFASKVTNSLLQHLSAIECDDFVITNTNILLAGGGSQLVGLDEYIEKALSLSGRCEVSRVNDNRFAGSMGALKLARELPADGWEVLRTQQEQTNNIAEDFKAA
jgi:rod shape-determining protein MreB and related proteins